MKALKNWKPSALKFRLILISLLFLFVWFIGIKSGANSRTGPVLVVAETSKPELLDKDLRDCFIDNLSMKAPKVEDRKEILQVMLGEGG